MGSLALLVAALASTAALAGRTKPAPVCNRYLTELNLRDEVPGLTLGNTHEVFAGEGRLLRGAQPLAKAKELVDVGVTDVVIYKNDVKGEVATEIDDLTKKLGLPPDRVHHFEMPWQDIKNPKAPCKHTIDAANLLLAVARTPGRTGYFHCTAGQDRTGMLAGILRMVTQGWSAEKAFFAEMCGHGYGFGHAARPAHVSGKVEANLTPIFLQIAAHLEGGGLSVASTLDANLCTKKARKPLDPKRFKCK